MATFMMDGSQVPDVGTSVSRDSHRLSSVWFRWVLLFICTLGFSFDLFELGLGGALSAVFSVPPQALPPLTLGWLISSVFIGAVVGAPAFGALADMRGRRFSMVSALALLSVMSLLASASHGIGYLILFRGLSGLGLGGFPPVLMVYLTDVFPPNSRGKFFLCMSAVALLGTTAGIFVVRGLAVSPPLGIEAWRWAFAAGGVGAALCAVLFMWLPESPAWASLIAGQHLPRATTSGDGVEPDDHVPGDAAAHDADRVPLAKRIRLFAIYLLSPWATSAFPMVLGALLIAKGLKLTDSLTLLGISTLGPVVGTLFVALRFDRIERKTALIASAALMVTFSIGFAATNIHGLLLTTATGFLIAALVYVSAMSIYTAEMVGPRHRGRLVAYSWAGNRIGAALAPLFILPLLKSSGPMAVVTVIVATLLMSIVLIATSARNRGSRVADGP